MTSCVFAIVVSHDASLAVRAIRELVDPFGDGRASHRAPIQVGKPWSWSFRPSEPAGMNSEGKKGASCHVGMHELQVESLGLRLHVPGAD